MSLEPKRGQMEWFVAACLGAVGGAVVQLIALYVAVGTWQEARRQAKQNHETELPPLSRYIDPQADTAVTLTRLVLGALAGTIFHSQIIGVAAAITVGASAPAVLQQLGNFRVVEDAIQQRVEDGSRPVPETT